MTVYVSGEGVLHGIPGWDGAACVELHGGLSNQTWRVTHGNRRAVLKIDDVPREGPFNSRLAERQVQNNAAEASLAPGVIYASETAYLSEYIDGTVWQRPCLDKPGNLEQIARALKRVHALPLTGRTFDAKVAARRYMKRISHPDSGLVEICLATVARQRLPQNLCCCHNDLVAENIISVPELLFLDWEYACDNDPFFDLATVAEHHQLDEGQVGLLLNTYFDGDGDRWREQLAGQQRLYLALLWLWLASRPASNAEELASVGVRVVTSCS